MIKSETVGITSATITGTSLGSMVIFSDKIYLYLAL